jgi:hypothetical protein
VARSKKYGMNGSVGSVDCATICDGAVMGGVGLVKLHVLLVFDSI